MQTTITASRQSGWPPSVYVAFASFGLYYCANLLWLAISLLAESPDPDALIGLTVGALVVVGFGFRQRMAWQWGRLLGSIFGGLYLLVLLVPALHPVARVIMALHAIGLLAMAVALGRTSAREHFGLFCESCGSTEAGKAANFFFTRVRCRDCGEEWS